MRGSLIRSRWAAFGAAVAVSVGAGGVVMFAHADSGSASTFVAIVPCRLFDTRTPPDNVGDRSTPLTSGETFTRQVWGTNGSCTIPTTATGIAYNMTVPDPPVSGFIKIYPADAQVPNASAINPVAGGGTKANSGIVGLSATGAIALFNQSGPLNALLDITGYFTPAGAGATGPQGPQGVQGPQGDPGPRPAQVVWVAKSGGDFTTVSAALASITDNATTRYVIKVAPGTYVEPAGIDLKHNVDIEGSGQSVTVISAPGTAGSNTTVRAPAGVLNAEVRNLSITNTGGGSVAVGLRVTSVTPNGGLRITDVTATASGSTTNYGSYVDHASPIITNLTTTATGGTDSRGYVNDTASPTVTHLVAMATGASATSYGIVNQNSSAPVMTDITAIASGAATSYGVFNNTSSTPTMQDVTATGSGGSVANRGIQNTAANSVLRDVVTTAVGTATGYADGIRVDSRTLTLSRVTAKASGSLNTGSNYGIFVGGTSSVVAIRDSTATATDASAAGIAFDSNSAVTVVGTYMSGSGAAIGAFGGSAKVVQSVFLAGLGVQAGGTLACQNVFKSDLATLAGAVGCG